MKNQQGEVKDAVAEFIYFENEHKVEDLIRNLVKKIAAHGITSEDAYTEFFKKFDDLFPENSKNIIVRESMIQRFQLMVQIETLRRVSRKPKKK